MYHLTLVISSLLLPLSTQAEDAPPHYISGVRLLTHCEKRMPEPQALCIGYILGIRDELDYVKAGRSNMCGPMSAEIRYVRAAALNRHQLPEG